jgi:hypothetical protein
LSLPLGAKDRFGEALNAYGDALDRCVADLIQAIQAVRFHPKDQPKVAAALDAWLRDLAAARDEFKRKINIGLAKRLAAYVDRIPE